MLREFDSFGSWRNRIAPLVLALLCLFDGTSEALASPISLIVPSAITFNTRGITGSGGEPLGGYVVAGEGAEPFLEFIERLSPGNSTQANFQTDEPAIQAHYIFLLWPTISDLNLAPGQAAGPIPAIMAPIYAPFFGPGEVVVPLTASGLFPVMGVGWPIGFTGNAQLHFVYDFGKGAPRHQLAFSVAATFVDQSGDSVITQAQRVELQVVPEPSILGLCAVAGFMGLRRRPKRDWRTAAR